MPKHTLRTAERPLHTSIRVRILRPFLLLTSITVLLLSFLSFIVSRTLLIHRISAQLATTVSAHENFLEETLRIDRQRTALLTSRPEVLQALGNGRSEEPLRQLLLEMKNEQVSLLGISVYDARGALARFTGEPGEHPSRVPSATTLSPSVDRYGRWRGYDVYSPIRGAGQIRGILVLRYDAAPLLQNFFHMTAFGEQGEMIIGWQANATLFAFSPSPRTNEIFIQDLGSMEEGYRRGIPLAKAVRGEEGVAEALNQQGRDVLAAYRSLPSLGWGMVIQIPTDEVLAGVWRLGRTLAGIGITLLGAAAVLGTALATSLAAPVISLSKRMKTLRPGHWTFQRDIDTGDEVEMLEKVVMDLSSRLQRTYEHLEEEVADRTEELRKQYALDRAILNSIEHGVITVDQDGRITDVNPAVEHLLGWKKAEYIGKNSVEFLQFRHHKGKIADIHPVKSCLRKRSTFRSNPVRHISIYKKDSSLLPILLIVSPLFAGKTCTGAIVLFQDMTEERQIDYMKSEFISLASHQLRTPLSTLRWYTELLSSDDTERFSATQKSYVKEIAQSTARMINLLDALLKVARLEGAALTPKKKILDVATFLKETVEELKVLARESGLPCSVSVPRRSLKIATDPVLLRIVLQNLFNNAVKYSRAGGHIQFSLNAGKKFIDISIADSGIGIPRNEWSRVFQKFFRAKNVRQMDTDGSGLGLYLCKTITESLGGTIDFKSQEGEGTEFRLRLKKNHL